MTAAYLGMKTCRCSGSADVLWLLCAVLQSGSVMHRAASIETIDPTH